MLKAWAENKQLLRGLVSYFNLSCFLSSRLDSLSCLLDAIIADASPSDIAL